MILRRMFLAALCLMLCPMPVLADDGKGTVLITGANRGIGLALAGEFQTAGYTVIGTARSPERAGKLKATGARVEALDVSDSASVKALAERLGDLPIDILINNAGIKGQDSSDLDGLDMDRFETVLDVNTLGPVRVIQALHHNVGKSDKKVIANISSMMGSNEMNTWGCCIAYRASKAAVNNITKTLAVDYGDEGMIFVTLHPGYVQTDMNDGKGNLTPEQSAAGLFRVITGLKAEDNGAYMDHAGKSLPW